MEIRFADPDDALDYGAPSDAEGTYRRSSLNSSFSEDEDPLGGGTISNDVPY